MSFFIEKEVECNFNFDYEKVAEAVVSASLEHESFPYAAEVNLTMKGYMPSIRSTDR